MIARYVLKSFRRRRVRTVLMVSSLVISTGLIVAMSATVETLSQSTVGLVTAELGLHDITIRRAETSSDQFIAVPRVSEIAKSADPSITEVFPRFHREIELVAGENRVDNAYLVALDNAEKTGRIELISGEHGPGEMRASLLRSTAIALGDVGIGDTVQLFYDFPLPREMGSVKEVGSSSRRATAQFVVSAIVEEQGFANVDEGIIVDLRDIQDTFGLADRAELLHVFVDPSMYQSGFAEEAVLAIRDVAINVQAALGDQYVVRAEKARGLDQVSSVFMVAQAGINTYGLMSLGVVGLLIYTLVMTNVQEQRRELAILRILGSQRNLLFGIVTVEVAIIGIIGITLGIVLGQAITRFGVVPFIERMMRREGLNISLVPAVTIRSLLPAILSATAVLFISSIRPARSASNTKVIHAINPGVADNLQIEDLESLRERRPNGKILLVGISILLFSLLLNVEVIAGTLGLPEAEGVVFAATLALMAAGLVSVFFILTRPLERLILRFCGLVAPRLNYFAAKNVGRGAERNTLISLLILLSGVFPSYLATQAAMDIAQVETDTKLSMGSQIDIRTWPISSEPESRVLASIRPSAVHNEIQAIPGIGVTVGLTDQYRNRIYDSVEMRSGRMRLIGVTGDLGKALYSDLVAFSSGGPESLKRMLSEPNAIIISRGMAEGLAIPLGGTLLVDGVGFDHREELTVVGIADRLPGFRNIGRIRSRMMDNGAVLISIPGYHRVVTDPQHPTPGADEPIVRRILATSTEEFDRDFVDVELRELLGDEMYLWMSEYETEVRWAREGFATTRVLLLALTLLSFATAVFGVFAVIYVTIYSRRREIGMLRAIGARRREVNRMLILESIAMTVGAAMAGILAGSSMAYLYTLVANALEERPLNFSIDTLVTPAILLLVAGAAVLGTLFSARRITKRKAIDILRMS